MKTRIIVTALLVAAIFGMALASQPKQIVTFELTSPDGLSWDVKAIVGDSPMRLTDVNGATWVIHVKGVETR